VMMSIGNEPIKLLANALDRASTPCFTVGIATPLAGYIYNVGGLRASLTALQLSIGLFTWIGAALALHFGARRALKGLVS